MKLLRQAERIARALSRDKQRKARLEAAEIIYEYTPLSKALEKPVKKKVKQEHSGAAVALKGVDKAILKKTKRKKKEGEEDKKVKKAEKLA